MTVLLPPRLRCRVTAIPHPTLPEPCWVWTGRLNRNGYGRIRWAGKEPVVHRLAYTLLVAPIPRTLLLDHLCRNRGCCNPAHLEPVTPRTNTIRGTAVLYKPQSQCPTPNS